jgi:hypothetical protein
MSYVVVPLSAAHRSQHFAADAQEIMSRLQVSFSSIRPRDRWQLLGTLAHGVRRVANFTVEQAQSLTAHPHQRSGLLRYTLHRAPDRHLSQALNAVEFGEVAIEGGYWNMSRLPGYL